jgi:hypothetical protein
VESIGAAAITSAIAGTTPRSFKTSASQGASRGQSLDQLAENHLRQIPAEQCQHRAEPGIARRLAEAREQIGKDFASGFLSGIKKPPIRRLRAECRGGEASRVWQG